MELYYFNAFAKKPDRAAGIFPKTLAKRIGTMTSLARITAEGGVLGWSLVRPPVKLSSRKEHVDLSQLGLHWTCAVYNPTVPIQLNHNRFKVDPGVVL